MPRFSSWRGFFGQLWCFLDQSPQIGCVFVTVKSFNSVNSLLLSVPFRLGLHCVCSSTVLPAFEQSLYDALFLLRQVCNLRRQFFVFSGSFFRCHSCLLWRLSQWAHPLEHWRWILALSAGLFLPIGGYCCSQFFFWRRRLNSYSIFAWISDCSRYFLRFQFLNYNLGLCALLVDSWLWSLCVVPYSSFHLRLRGWKQPTLRPL